MNATNQNLFLTALNRLRRQMFGDEPLTLFETTPETGETGIVSYIKDWSGRRVESTTDSTAETGFWQFQIAASGDWKTSDIFMLRVVAFSVGERRFKCKKVEKPFGNSKVWKLKGELQ